MVATGVSVRLTEHILEALLPQKELKEREHNNNVHRYKTLQLVMSHTIQSIRKFNNVELHRYPSQYNPCLSVRLRPLLV